MNVENTLLLFGKYQGALTLAFVDPDAQQSPRTLKLPDISLEDIRVMKSRGNYFLKTHDALLFLYTNSPTPEWLIEGKILAYNGDGALYERDGVLWQASWKESE